MMKKTYKLDLFNEILPALDNRDLSFYRNLTEDRKKAFSGKVAMRAMSGVSNIPSDLCEYHITIVNEAANIHFWNADIAKHPELQYLSLAVCGSGYKQRHIWIKDPKRRAKENKIIELIQKIYPNANSDEIEYFIELNKDSLFEIAIMMGYQNEELKELKKELKNYD